MNIKFIRNIFLSIIICLLTISCEGNDCIEADDFGEYDTDLITIDSKISNCGLNNDEIYQSSSEVQTCLIETTKSINLEDSNKIQNSKGKDISCYDLYSCSIKSINDNCYNDYEIIGADGKEVKDSTGEKVKVDKSILQKAYNSCSETCVKECLKDIDMDAAFETGWIPNNKKDDKSGFGIKLPLGQNVNIQVVGNVKLTESSEQSLKFVIGNREQQDSLYKIFKNGKFFRDNLGPVLFGGWCFGDNKDSSKCSGDNIRWIGEINNQEENLTGRYDFLRRGVVILTRIPENGKIDKDNKYTGPELFPDFSTWSCDYDEQKKVVTNCKAHYEGDYAKENNANFAMDNDFVKVNGGLVVPEQVSKLILGTPPIPTESDENFPTTENNPILLNNTSSNVYKFEGEKIISTLYPVKLAFSAPDLKTDTNSETDNNCEISIDNNRYTVNIDPAHKNEWFFVSDNNGNHVIFNKDDYNTLKLDKSTNTIDWSNTFNISIHGCQKGNFYVPIYVFIMPQNEILIDKSGFVSFKTLLGNFDGKEISFDIINPMYEKSSNDDNLSNNFYEYIYENKKSIKRTITLKENDWSNEIFVRKGQILRFDSDSWFDITKQNNSDSSTITGKTSKVNNSENIVGIGDSLVLKIEYRPALLCSGTKKETIDNPECSKKRNEGGSMTCLDTRYSTLCVAYEPTNNKCEDNSLPNSDGKCYDRYCPMGCYCKKKDGENNCKEFGYLAVAEEFMKGKCFLDDKATSDSCKKCNDDKLPGDISLTKEVEAIQCYDLENYKGAVRNLFDESNSNQLLSGNAEELGAKKLASIFEGGDYGNLDGMDVDNVYKNFTDSTFSEFRYNSPFVSNSLNSEINSANKYFSFLIINNNNFEFNSEFKSAGEYNLIFNPEKRVSNGEQLAIALVNSDHWNGSENDKNFRGWITKYNTNKDDKYGNLIDKKEQQQDGVIVKDASSYLFDNNGYISNLTINLGALGENDKVDNLRLFFKIIDKLEEKGCQIDGQGNNVGDENNGDKTKVLYEEELCRCPNSTGDYQLCQTMDACVDGDNNFVEPKRKTQKKCVNSYYNNDGSYTIKLKTPKDTTNATSYIVKYIMKPVLEILDGKNVGLRVDNNGNLVSCNASSKGCAFYFPESEFSEYENRFGESCKFTNNISTNAICYETCAGLDDSLYSKHCKYFNNGGGFLQRFYVAVITDNYYQTIVKLCFTLMITFYGMYYLMGMAELTHGELVKRAFKISFIYLMIGTKGWEYYNMFFVKFFKQGVDYLVFSVASAFDDNANLMSAFVKGDFYDKSVLFSGVDKNLSLLFSDAVSYKIWGLFFVSFFGWLYVFIIYSSILTYIFSVANAMLLYVTAQFFLSLLLAMGPIFFVMLIFDKTKEMFNKWISNLISFGLEQIFLLTCLSLFNILVYNIIKYVLSFRVCWKAVWEMNIPLLGSLQMMSFWKATTSTSATAAATAVPGLFQILLIYLIADLMNKFIQLSTQLGGSIGGSGMYLDSLAEGIKGDVGGLYEKHIKKPIKEKTQKIGTDFLKQTIGYKTADEEKKETENSKKAQHASRKATRDAEEAVSDYKKNNYKELLNMTAQERMDKLADVRKDAWIESFKKAGGEAALKDLDLTFKDKDGKKQKLTTAEQMFENKISGHDLNVSHSLVHTALNATRISDIFNLNNVGGGVKSLLSGHTNTGVFKSAKKTDEDIRLGDKSQYSWNEKHEAAKNERDRQKKDLAKRSFWGKLSRSYWRDRKDLQAKTDMKEEISRMNKANAEQTEKNKQELEEFKNWQKEQRKALEQDETLNKEDRKKKLREIDGLTFGEYRQKKQNKTLPSYKKDQDEAASIVPPSGSDVPPPPSYPAPDDGDVPGDGVSPPPYPGAGVSIAGADDIPPPPAPNGGEVPGDKDKQ